MSDDPGVRSRPAPLRAGGRPTSRLAVGGLLLSILGFSLVGLIVSVMAFPETRSGLSRGYGYAIAGAVLGGIGTAVWTLVLVLLLGRSFGL